MRLVATLGEWCGRAASASRDDPTARPRLGGPKSPVSGLDPAQRLLGVRADQVQVLGFLDRTLGGGEHQAQLLGDTRLASVGDDHGPHVTQHAHQGTGDHGLAGTAPPDLAAGQLQVVLE